MKDTAKVTGNGKIYIDRNSDIASVYRYNYMSSPVTTEWQQKHLYSSKRYLKMVQPTVDANGTVGQKQDYCQRLEFYQVTMGW